jgi:RES domain-containing protein
VTFFRLEALPRSEARDAFSGEGGLHVAGRWNSLGTRVVYTSGSAALACLETLVHLQKLRSTDERWLFAIEVPDRVVEDLRPLPRGWNARPRSTDAAAAGDRWITEQRSVALLVPSVIVPMEKNALINPRHPQFRLEWVKKPVRFQYDPRLKG